MNLHLYSVPGLLGLLRSSKADTKKSIEEEIQKREKQNGRKYPRPY